MNAARSVVSLAWQGRHTRHIRARTASCLTILTLLGVAAAIPAQAQLVFARSGPNESGYGLSTYPFATFNNQSLSASWSETNGFSNAYVYARLSGGTPDSGTSGTAYLTTQLGPAASAADLVATSNFAFPTSEANVALFSGLSLLPNTTYYLTISGNDTASGAWFGTSTPTVQTAPGVTDNGSYYTHDLSAFPPSETFISDPGAGLIYTVAAYPAPETSTAASLGALLALSLGGLAVAGRRRTVGPRVG